VDVVLAVLERRLELNLGGLDIYVNLAGGLKVIDPGLDLAVALAVYSAVMMKPIPEGIAVFGEVGLAGEVRSVSQPARRAAEATRVGIERLIAPPGVQGSRSITMVREAVQMMWQQRAKV
jgi:DNA repair protein RadA/Sms